MNLSQSSVDTLPPTILPHVAFNSEAGIIIRDVDKQRPHPSALRSNTYEKADVNGQRQLRQDRRGGASRLGNRQEGQDRSSQRTHNPSSTPSSWMNSGADKDAASSHDRSGTRDGFNQGRTRNLTFCVTEDGTLQGSSGSAGASHGRIHSPSYTGEDGVDDANVSVGGGAGGGYSIWRTWPLQRLTRRGFAGTLSAVHPLPFTSLVLLHAGGRDPLHPPNKLVIYDDDAGRKVAQLEFREQVRAVRCRLGGFVVLLSRSAIWFEYGMCQGDEDGEEGEETARSISPTNPQQPTARPSGSIADYYASASRRSSIASLDSDPPVALFQAPGFWVEKRGGWQTSEIVRSGGGAADSASISLSTHTGGTLLVIPGRQVGQLQIVTLPPVPALIRRDDGSLEIDPSPAASTGIRPKQPIVIAHENALACVALSGSERHIATASTKGTLVRVWDTTSGALVRELRRGMEHVEVLGMAFDGDRRLACWSDKGSIHIWHDILAPLQASDKSASSSETGGIRGTKTTARLKSMLNPLKAYLPQSASYFQALPSSSQYYLQRDNQLRTPLPTLSFDEPGFAEVEPPQPTPKELKLGERYTVGWIDFDSGDFEPDPLEPDEWPDWQRAFADKVRPAPRTDRPNGAQLVVLTHSGEYIRLSLPEDTQGLAGDDDSDDASSSSVGRDGRDHSRKRYRHRCKVEEYRTLQTVVSS